jgi:tripartite-type tricarboxylate transporter receptor subunit TctC
MKSFRHILRAAAPLAIGLVAAVALPLAASAQTPSDWPSRPLTVIAPFPAGGVADTIARNMADGLSKQMGQTVVVENRGGGGPFRARRLYAVHRLAGHAGDQCRALQNPSL